MITALNAEGTWGRASDATLVASVRGGDEAAFGELYRRYQPEIRRFVLARVRDQGGSEDVTQDAFLSALRRLRETEDEVAFRPWIYEIARNATIDRYRRSTRAEEVSIDSEGMVQADVVRLAVGPQPDASLMAHESLDSLKGALDELSETHRRAIVLRELEGRSYSEIGASLDLSQSAVESTLFRARRKLEQEYIEQDSGHRCRLVGAAIGRLAEGFETGRDRRRLDRHARHCSTCRRRARMMGVEPMLPRRHIAARAAALLPLPAFLRRRIGDGVAASGDAGHSSALALAPAVEVTAGAGGKAVALLVTAAFVGGGGATLGGTGPLALHGDQAVAPPAAAPSAEPAPTPPRKTEAPTRAPRHVPARPPAKPGLTTSPGSERAVGRARARPPAGKDAPDAARTPPPPAAQAPGGAVPVPAPAPAPAQDEPAMPGEARAPSAGSPSLTATEVPGGGTGLPSVLPPSISQPVEAAVSSAKATAEGYGA